MDLGRDVFAAFFSVIQVEILETRFRQPVSSEHLDKTAVFSYCSQYHY